MPWPEGEMSRPAGRLRKHPRRNSRQVEQTNGRPMNFLLRSRGFRRIAASSDEFDASLYDAFISKFTVLGLNGMVAELRGWSDATPASRATAAMARLLDLSLLSDSLPPAGRRRAAILAIVVEKIVRSKLRNQHAAISTIEGAYRLLLHFGETHSPCPDVADWIRRERLARGLPPIGKLVAAREG
jgi:hypothetical protein